MKQKTGASMRRMVNVCMRWTAENGDRAHRGIAPVILKGKEGGRSMDLKRLNEDIEAVRERVNHYEVIGSSFDDDYKPQHDAWMKKSQLANRVLAYLIALKSMVLEKEDDGK